MDSLLLASASPRRAELLDQLGVPYSVRAVDVDETPLAGEQPHAYVRRVAEAKAGAASSLSPGVTVLAADTTVVVTGQILGKPGSAEEARQMLEALSGGVHEVMTAVAMANATRSECITQVTRVEFRPLRLEEMAAYVQTKEPYDKAGGYGIQGIAQCFIRRIDGSYSGVMGLPLAETAELLHLFGLSPERYWSERERRDTD